MILLISDYGGGGIKRVSKLKGKNIMELELLQYMERIVSILRF